MTFPPTYPPGLVVGPDGRYDLACPECGKTRRLLWGGMVEYRQAVGRICLDCLMTPSIPEGVQVGSDGRYDLRCRRCGVARRIVWFGPVEHERARDRVCAACFGNTPLCASPAPDPLVVDLMVQGGYRVNALKTERLLAMREMVRRYPRWPAWKLADRLNVTIRTVERYRAELRRPVAA